MVMLDDGVVNGAVHPLHLHVVPWQIWLGKPALDPIRRTIHGAALRFDAEFPAQLRGRSLRLHYCCFDNVRGHGQP